MQRIKGLIHQKGLRGNHFVKFIYDFWSGHVKAVHHRKVTAVQQGVKSMLILKSPAGVVLDAC
jgi:hypothetical protein